jgi:signal transduction histidine kinase
MTERTGERGAMIEPADPSREGGSAASTGARGGRATTAAGRAARMDLRLLQALSDAARDLHRSLSLAEIGRVATERARQIVGAREAATSHAPDGDWTRALHASARVDDGHGRTLRSPDPEDGGPAWEVCRTNRPLRLASSDRAMDGAAPGDGVAADSWLGAPLVGSDGTNLGLIQLAGKLDGDEFTAADETIAVQLARMASVAIENARLYQAALDARAQAARAARVEHVRGAELRALINAIGEPVLVCDGEGKVDFANRAAEALFGDRPVASWSDLVSRFRLPPHDRFDPVAAPVEVPLADASGRWYELRAYEVPAPGRPASDAEDRPGRIVVLRDVSAARQARAQREAFLGILSHELRTPITTIYAGSRVLAREHDASPRARELAADVSAEAERLFRLVEDLLVMTRSERGVLQLAQEPVLVQRIVDGAIRLERTHWPTARIRSVSDSSSLPAVAGDATYVEQVVRNLLSNAAKYSPPDAEIEVRLENAPEGVVCRVLDRGRGFPSPEAEDLFELFYRAPATAAQAAGAGIGLFVCRRLVLAMGGRIWARPRPGGGAEFGFLLRRYDEDDAAEA